MLFIIDPTIISTGIKLIPDEKLNKFQDIKDIVKEVQDKGESITQEEKDEYGVKIKKILIYLGIGICIIIIIYCLYQMGYFDEIIRVVGEILSSIGGGISYRINKILGNRLYRRPKNPFDDTKSLNKSLITTKDLKNEESASDIYIKELNDHLKKTSLSEAEIKVYISKFKEENFMVTSENLNNIENDNNDNNDNNDININLTNPKYVLDYLQEKCELEVKKQVGDENEIAYMGILEKIKNIKENNIFWANQELVQACEKNDFSSILKELEKIK